MPSLQWLPGFHLVGSLEVLLVGFALYYACWMIYAHFFHPLAKIPGPFWASFSSLWYFDIVLKETSDAHQMPLHEKYGPIVRIAPNDLSVSDPEAIGVIYNAKKPFAKSGFYDSFVSHINPNRRDLFTERNDKNAADLRRTYAHLYTQSAVLNYEPRIDYIVELCSNVIAKVAESGETIDMTRTFRQYSFDVLGEIFYGKKGGFNNLHDDKDYNNWMAMIRTTASINASTNWLPKFMRLPFLMSGLVRSDVRTAVKGHFQVIADAKSAVRQRQDDIKAGRDVPTHDMLTKLLAIMDDKSNKLDFSILDVDTHVWGIIWAGAETTATTLTSIFYHLLKHSDCLEKLLREIDDAFATGNLTEPIHYMQAVKLPYLNACVKEAMRIHPGLGMTLPRSVPEGGTTIAGRFIPAGTIVGVNAIVVQRDKSVFGQDADDFVPERWIQCGEKAAARMERTMMVFGTGQRICLGKQISYTEMFKLLPTILRKYDFELLSPEWNPHRSWFADPSEVLVRVKNRA
ncbi:hypothetical protein FH972_021559 [Carpinus fangiana]|uniref:Cytochrome P450 n=1 Tax=Carpinus fangiana TaxID=176857 RepID=A0A5N6KRU5_9ROSI|nr:hypothetical protein FH972_021559 [Carpinus fangiana]